MTDLPQPTPEWKTKPHLMWCGKLLGMDLFVDVGQTKNAENKLAIARNLLKQMFEPPKNSEDK